MKNAKRFLSMLLVVATLCSMLPTAAFAVEEISTVVTHAEMRDNTDEITVTAKYDVNALPDGLVLSVTELEQEQDLEPVTTQIQSWTEENDADEDQALSAIRLFDTAFTTGDGETVTVAQGKEVEYTFAFPEETLNTEYTYAVFAVSAEGELTALEDVQQDMEKDCLAFSATDAERFAIAALETVPLEEKSADEAVDAPTGEADVPEETETVEPEPEEPVEAEDPAEVETTTEEDAQGEEGIHENQTVQVEYPAEEEGIHEDETAEVKDPVEEEVIENMGTVEVTQAPRLALSANSDIVDSGTCGENLTWELDGNGTLTISGTGEMPNWDSGAWAGAKNPSPWAENKKIFKVVIRPGVQNIGNTAFLYCTELQDVSLPNGLISIGISAFQGTSIESIDIPSTVTSIGDAAFYACPCLKQIYIPENVTTVGGGCFAFCDNLTEVFFSDNVTTIGGTIFHGCRNLRTVKLPAKLENIESEMFRNCQSLQNVTIPKVDTIKYAAFMDCKSLNTVIIPEGVRCLEQQAFWNCKNLTTVIMPDSLENIDFPAIFGGCSSLKSITIPVSVTRTSHGVFENCESLNSVYFTGFPIRIDYDCFKNIGDNPTFYYPRGNTYWIDHNYGDEFNYDTWNPDGQVIVEDVHHGLVNIETTVSATYISEDQPHDAYLEYFSGETYHQIDAAITGPFEGTDGIEWHVSASFQPDSEDISELFLHIDGTIKPIAFKFDSDGSESEQSHIHYMGNFDIVADSWSFVNANSSFLDKGETKYSISQTRYVDVFGTDYYRVARSSKEAYKSMIPSSWGGNCYGMSLLAAQIDSGRISWSALNSSRYSTVNDYYDTIVSSIIDGCYTTAGHYSDVTQWIENYQVWDSSTDKNSILITDSGYKGFLVDNGESSDNKKKKFTHSFSHDTSGNYIDQVLSLVKTSDEPLILGFCWSESGKGKGHAVLAYGWEKEDWNNEAQKGWYKIFIYDPNFPHPNKAMAKNGSKYACCYNTTDLYIELNPSQNKWRYNHAGVNSTSKKKYVGCDASGNVILGEYKNDHPQKGKTYMVQYPDLLYVHRPSLAPAVFNGTAKYTTTYGTNIHLAPDSNIIVQDENGNVIASVYQGNCVCLDSAVGFDGYYGYVPDSDSTGGGILHIPYDNYTIQYESGDDITVIGADNIINLRFSDDADIQVNAEKNSVEIASEDKNDVSIQMTNLREPGDFTSVQFEGQMDEGTSASVTLKENDIVETEVVSSGSGTELDMYTSNAESEERSYIETIDQDETFNTDLTTVVPGEKPKSIFQAEVTGMTDITYTGEPVVQSIAIELDGTTLVPDVDYTVAYINNINVGTATVTITGTGNYTGSISKTFKINAASISGATVTGITNKTYTGSAITQVITVEVGSTTLKDNVDYTVAYQNNTNAGTATVTITGKGNYTGTVSKTFKINKADQTLTANSSASSLIVGKTATITAKGTGLLTYASSNTEVATVSENGIVTAHAPGTVTITVRAEGNDNYNAATKTVNITVTSASLSADKQNISSCTVKVENTVYSGKAQTPSPEVKAGSTVLKGGIDYTVSYQNNTNAGIATVTITGKGEYTGIKKVNFQIGRANQILTASVAANMIAGKTATVSAKGTGTITFKSSNTTVATVNEKGVVTAKTPGTVKITVKAAGNGNYNGATSTVTVKVTCGTPAIKKAQNVNGGVKLTWGKVVGAVKYRVFYKNAKGKWVKLGDTTKTSYTWKKAKSGTKYTFTVRCISKGGKKTTSGFNKTGKSIKYIAAPKLTKVQNTKAGVKVTWKKSAGAVKYRVLRKTGKGKWVKVGDTTKLTYVDKKAKKGVKYTYTVRCITKNGKSYTSAYNAKGLSIKRK